MNYRLEFNEKTQQFHHDNYTHKENTHGWATICLSCNDLEVKMFEAFIHSKLTKRFTTVFLRESWAELQRFYKALDYFAIMYSIEGYGSKITSI